MSDTTSPLHIQIEHWPLERLFRSKTPVRKNDQAVQRMIESIQAYGFRVPLLVSEESEIIDGDLRLNAAKKLGFSELPVIVCAGWSPEQIRAARLMFNRSATWAEWAPRGFAIPDFSDTSSKVPFPRFRYSRFVPPEKP